MGTIELKRTIINSNECSRMQDYMTGWYGTADSSVGSYAVTLFKNEQSEYVVTVQVVTLNKVFPTMRQYQFWGSIVDVYHWIEDTFGVYIKFSEYDSLLQNKISRIANLSGDENE